MIWCRREAFVAADSERIAMAKREMRWVKQLSVDEKLAVASARERFIADVLKPRFLPSRNFKRLLA